MINAMNGLERRGPAGIANGLILQVVAEHCPACGLFVGLPRNGQIS